MTGGIVAIGDSITNSCGFPAGNLPLASWAQWVARGLDEPITIHARPGYTAAQVRAELLPEVTGRYRLALVYVGTNDMLRARPVADFVADYAAILARAAEVSETVLTLTLPLWVGRVPTIAPYGRRLRRIYAYGDAMRKAAAEVGALVVQAPEVHGPRYVAADRVHPTAAGHVAFADAAAWALRDAGWTIQVPSHLAGEPDPVTAVERREWVAGSLRPMVEAPLRHLARRLR